MLSCPRDGGATASKHPTCAYDAVATTSQHLAWTLQTGVSAVWVNSGASDPPPPHPKAQTGKMFSGRHLHDAVGRDYRSLADFR